MKYRVIIKEGTVVTSASNRYFGLPDVTTVCETFAEKYSKVLRTANIKINYSGKSITVNFPE